MNYQWMQQQVTSWLGLQDIEPLDETVLAQQLIYDGTIDMLSRTRCVARCVQLHVFAGQQDYILDKLILALVDVEDGARHRLRRDQDDLVSPDAQIVTVPGGVSFYRGYGFTLVRSDVLRIVPEPSEDGTVQVWAVIRPVPMVLPTDSLDLEPYGGIPVEYHDAVVTYAMWKASDYADDAGSAQGERYRQLYEGQDGRGGRIAQIKSLVNKRGTARAPRARVRLRRVSSHQHWVG